MAKVEKVLLRLNLDIPEERMFWERYVSRPTSRRQEWFRGITRNGMAVEDGTLVPAVVVPSTTASSPIAPFPPAQTPRAAFTPAQPVVKENDSVSKASVEPLDARTALSGLFP